MLAARSRCAGRSLAPVTPAAINFFPVNGQSLSVGQTPTLISSTDNAHALMFQCGVRPQYTSTPSPSYTSLVPLKEQDDAAAPWNGVLLETPCSGAADMIAQLLESEDGIDQADLHRMLMSAPGYGAIDIAGLSAGTTHFERMIAQANAGRTLAAAGGNSYGVLGQGWIQGESDYINATGDRAYYAAAMVQLAIDFASRGRTAGRQDFQPITVIAQNASHTHNTPAPASPWVALGQLDAALTRPDLIVMACAMGQLEYQGDQTTGDWHLLASSSRWLGAYLGLALKRRMFDGLATWGATRAVSATKSGRVITVQHVAPTLPIQFETTWMAERENYGFDLVDGSGNALGISSVGISGQSQVVITASADIPSGARIRYGWRGTVAPGRFGGPGGNVCDSTATTFQVTSGDVRTMRSYALTTETVIT